MSVREVREDLSGVINGASGRGQVTFITSHGRRVAAMVPVAIAEEIPAISEMSEDATTAVMYAVNVVMRKSQGAGAEVFEEYATDLLREFGGSAERAMSAARDVAIRSRDDVGYPMRWQQVMMAVELCQRAVEISGQVLPGSYRPGSQNREAGQQPCSCSAEGPA